MVKALRRDVAPEIPDDVDVDELIDLWDELVLPPSVSQAWIQWLAERRQAIVQIAGRASPIGGARRTSPTRGLTGLQARVAALVVGLPESECFVLAGGAAMAAHGVLDRTTRDLEYFAGPDDAAAVPWRLSGPATG